MFRSFYGIRNYHNVGRKFIYSMETAYFRYVKGDNQFDLTFEYKNESKGVSRIFNFKRNVDESIDVCLERIKANVQKAFQKKNKKAKNKVGDAANSSENQEVTVSLLRDDLTLQSIKFSEIIDTINKGYQLKVVDCVYNIALNKPWVNSISLPSSILAGFYVYPSKLELDFAVIDSSKFCWYRKNPEQKDSTWVTVGNEFMYLTTVDDIGCLLKVQCTPGNSNEFGTTTEVTSKNVVSAGPGHCLFDNRNAFTTSYLTGNEFRVVSYNILADLYADSDYSRSVLFPYIPPYALHIDYRKQLFLKEIVGYRADLICLQEVDHKIFELDLNVMLKNLDYAGQFKHKGQTAEGLATFYNTRRFRLIESHGINIGENLSTMDIFKDVYEKIKLNTKLIERVQDVSTAVQVNIFQCIDNGKYLVVANTHLYFHPDADHIRLLQIGISMLYVKYLYDSIKSSLKLDDNQIAIMFCGDFNSTPDCGIYQLMTKQHVPDDYLDWGSNKEQAIEHVALHQPFKFNSACGCPSFTNFTPGFVACIDYIFHETDKIKVTEVIPLPSKEEVQAYTAIPSIVCPSDHIALVANMQWIDT